jgi:penicillin-binding protein 2
VTPLQLAYAIGGIANRGVFMRPHVARLDQPEPPARKVEFHPENVRKVVAGMCAVVNEWGTASASRIPGITMCGKTGTAQLASNDLLRLKNSSDWHDNAWFVGFAPPENPEIVVAVLWENGAHGDMAAPIARDVIKAWFDKKSRLQRLARPPASLASAWLQPPSSLPERR